ncbi:hypothetical protein ACL6C3_11840 [Capilliphycus salinus ALCB114379]|uniref:hypothetical protein n=1 Tax=Capilliphycus salinus TaxID=2768948 RepID=UPI0039A5960E
MNHCLKVVQNPTKLQRQTHGIVSVFISLLIGPFLDQLPSFAQVSPYCQLSPEQITLKESMRLAASSSQEAQKQYEDLLTQHAQAVFQCRRQSWLKDQAIWLRLYPCDAQPGAIDKILDDIVNRGYNKVYLEVFYDGQVLLPASENNTPWPSVLRSPGTENIDLYGETVQKGRRRGLEVYAWAFLLNFGYTYSLRADREDVLARNGNGETTVTAIAGGSDSNDYGESYTNQGFVDPYHPQARQDYQTLLNAILSRRPQGVLFDYVRYPKGLGGASVAAKVKDLWIYGDASQREFLQRGNNDKGKELMRRFLNQGYLTETDIKQVNALYPEAKKPNSETKEPNSQVQDPNSKTSDRDSEVKDNPLWQDEKALTPLASLPLMGESLQQQLWRLSVAHAQQGILEFLGLASQTVQQRGLSAGAVFFPEGNRRIREQGFDSRLQPWDQFSSRIEWHPMSYGVCGNTSCIVSQVQTVVTQAPSGTEIIPALAGDWGKAFNNRPSLESQMQDIHNTLPQINAISHYSYDWQDPEFTRQRKFCQR